jgi:hypothetical protein
VNRIVGSGDTLVMEGRYTGSGTATGRQLDAQVADVWDFRDGKVVRFQQYVNTAHLQQVLGLGEVQDAAVRSSGQRARLTASSACRTQPGLWNLVLVCSRHHTRKPSRRTTATAGFPCTTPSTSSWPKPHSPTQQGPTAANELSGPCAAAVVSGRAGGSVRPALIAQPAVCGDASSSGQAPAW